MSDKTMPRSFLLACCLSICPVQPVVGAQESERAGPAGSSTKELDAICLQFAETLRQDVARRPPSESRILVGVLPFVFQDAGGASVPILGVDLANYAHERLTEHLGEDTTTDVLAPEELGAVLQEMNIRRSSLSDLRTVVAHGARLGVDVVLFGSFKRVDSGRPVKDLRFDLFLQNVDEGSNLDSRKQLTIPNKGRVNRDVFSKLDVSSEWDVADDLLPDAGGLDDELRVVMQMLSRAIERKGLLADVPPGKHVYVAPADSREFSQEIGDLRAIQASFFKCREERKSGPAEEANRPVELGGIRHATFEAARDHVNKVREDVMRGDAMRFAKTLGHQFVEALDPRLTELNVIRDLTYLETSDTAELEDMLATGGIVGDRATVDYLVEEGMASVVQLRFQKYSSHYRMFANIYDLRTRTLAFTTSFPVDPEYTSALSEQLAGRHAVDDPALPNDQD